MNPYQTLNVNTDATDDEVNKAYRAQSLIHHPDKGGDAEKFNEARKARDLLLNPEHRRAYDEHGVAPDTEGAELLLNAKKILSDVFNSLVAQSSLEEIAGKDIVKHIREQVQAAKSQVKRDLADFQSELNRIKNTEKLIAKRMRKKSKTDSGDNIFVASIKRLAKPVELKADQARGVLKILTKALEILSDYKFDVDDTADAKVNQHSHTVWNNAGILINIRGSR